MSISKYSLKPRFCAWLIGTCLQTLQEPSHPASIVDRAGKANEPWSIAVCQLAEETTDKVEKALLLAELGHRTPAGVAAERL